MNQYIRQIQAIQWNNKNKSNSQKLHTDKAWGGRKAKACFQKILQFTISPLTLQKVFSSDDYAGDELLSETVISLDEILGNMEGEKEFGLVKGGSQVGSVKLRFLYDIVRTEVVG